MSSLWERASAAADSLLPALLAHVWSSTLFLLLVLAVLFALRHRLTASARFAVALVGILKFALPGALVMRGVRLVAGDLLKLDSPDALLLPLSVVGGTLPLNPAPAAHSQWPVVLMFVWLAVALMLIVRSTLTRRRLVAISMRTALPPQPREVAALSRARHRVGVRRSIDIVRSALPEAPAVLRALRPVIVLPHGGCDELSEGELEALLCHECAHVARHDNFVASVEGVICALFWFNPVLWIAQRITVIERERACDEAVAALAGERETYLTALTKFCHAAIAPRLPGVSCMATALLKERMDHVMNYPALRATAPSTRRVTVLAGAALALFSLISGMTGSDRAFAGDTAAKGFGPYAIRVTATRSGDAIALECSISENATQKVVAAPRMTLTTANEQSVTVTTVGEINIWLEARPREDRVELKVEINRNGRLVQHDSFVVSPRTTDAKIEPFPEELIFTGEPITLRLTDADIRDVIGTFGEVTGLTMQMDESVQGKVTVAWVNVPWDQAFDSMLKDNGMAYRMEKGTVHISKK